MSSGRCVNCREEASERYGLLLRSTKHDSVPLCDECRAAIEAETGETLQPQ